MERKVHFKDCKVGMKFKIDRFSDLAKAILTPGEFDSPTIVITAEIIKIDEGDESVFCRFYINEGQKLPVTAWLLESPKVCYSIPSILHFVQKSKKKNNYY